MRRMGIGPQLCCVPVILVAVCALVAATFQRQPQVLEGDWAGWLYPTEGGDAPF